MARGKTLGEVLADLRAELRQSSNPAVAQSQYHVLANAIKRTQEFWYEQVDWPHLIVWESKAIVAGSRYYDWPTTLNYDRIVKARARFGNQWVPITGDLDVDDYNAHDSDNDERVDPILKYRPYTNAQFEVWPLPATAGSVRFKGVRKLTELSGESSTLDLDNRLIALFAAADLLADKPDGAKKEQMGLAHLNRLRGNASTVRPFRLGEDTPAGRPVREMNVRVTRE